MSSEDRENAVKIVADLREPQKIGERPATEVVSWGGCSAASSPYFADLRFDLGVVAHKSGGLRARHRRFGTHRFGAEAGTIRSPATSVTPMIWARYQSALRVLSFAR